MGLHACQARCAYHLKKAARANCRAGGPGRGKRNNTREEGDVPGKGALATQLRVKCPFCPGVSFEPHVTLQTK
eukprot:9164536-Alexandrium_andersonii.AAC.1